MAFFLNIIHRWISECPPGNKCCPNCKTKAAVRDFRFIYAKKIVAVDKSEEINLRNLLSAEKDKYKALQEKYGTTLTELELQRKYCQLLLSQSSSSSTTNNIKCNRIYKLFMEKNIDICHEAGCRVILYGQKENLLIVSQKATRSLFPGFGIRLIDPTTFTTSSFFNTAVKCIRDMSLDATEDLLITASQDRGTKLFDIHNKSVVTTFNPCDKILWSSAFDFEREKSIYLGTSTGSIFTYDIRNPNTYVDEFITEGDGSPVINICPVGSERSNLPFGGILVCKLQSIWFFENIATQEVTPIKLNVDGPFTSMSYDRINKYVLISTRPNSKHPTTRHLIGKLKKINDVVTLIIENCFNGSKTAKMMVRSSQMRIDDDVVVAAYLEDKHCLTTWSLNNKDKLQSLPIADTIYDSCAIYSSSSLYLGAVTDMKCKIYKVTSNET